jgi:tight adherence protein C
VILLIIILVFGAISVLVAGFAASSRRMRVSERISEVRGAVVPQRLTPLEEELQRSFYTRIITPILQRVGTLIMRLAPGQALAQSRMKLERAGSRMPVPTFIVLRTISAVIGCVAAVYVFGFAHSELKMRLLYAAGLLVVGMMLPEYLLSSATQKRKGLVRKALPDIIDLLVVSTEAGAGLDGALQEVVRRKTGPLSEEFRRVLTEVRLGKRRRDAWHDMAERVDTEELRMLVSALHQAEQLGVSIANTLRAQSDALRTKKSLRIRTLAATLSVKMLFPLIFFIFPTLFIVVIGPGALAMAENMRGFGQ